MKRVIRVCVLLAVVFLTATSLCAQSIDPNTPTPVRSSTVTGSIAARDLGDARLTDHYYAVTGTPGDLLITVQSRNLNGDIDVFTAGTLRPLLKLTLYADSAAPLTKSIYLRRREDLVLRVEARSPNDEEGSYRLVFGGSFEPIVGGPDIAENETPTAPKVETPTTGRRVSSVGARIEEPARPATEVAATPTPEPTPEPPEAKPIESPKPEEAKPAEKTPTVRPPRRNTRQRPPAAPRSWPKSTETTRTTESPKPEQPKVEEPKAEEPKAEPEPEPEAGPRLVIETKDGTLINRPMSGVRRVTVERGQVVVVGRDGKIDRILLADVLRMSIAP